MKTDESQRLRKVSAMRGERADGEVVFDFSRARSGPGGVQGLLVFRMRADGAVKADYSMGDVHLDVTSIDQGAALQGCFDGRPDICEGR
jgi:hypothetical protein